MSAPTRVNRSAGAAQLPTIHQPDVPAASGRLTEAQFMRHEVESLCSHMLWMRAWWEGHKDAIKAADPRAANCIHDHFIGGAMFARSIADKAGFDLDEDRMRNYSWGRNMQTARMVGGAQ